MDKLQVIIMQYILGFALQSFLLVLGIYTFNRQEIVFKDYILTSIIVTITSYIMKLLPITIGVQTIINMLFVYLICVVFIKMTPYKTIRSTLMCLVLILFCEMIVTAGAMFTMGQELFEIIINDPIKRTYIGVVANIIFGLLVLVSRYILRGKGDSYGNTSS